jgi:hypothetical protein
MRGCWRNLELLTSIETSPNDFRSRASPNTAPCSLQTLKLLAELKRQTGDLVLASFYMVRCHLHDSNK